jgi:dihydrofolate reductase
MSRIINSVAMTLDGVIEPVGPEWFVAEGDHDEAARELLAHSTGMVLGRTTFEGLAGYWAPLSNPWADIINPMPKYVASRSRLSALEWNGIPIEGDAIEGVRRLKAETDGNLFMSGCGELARELIQAGLVDEVLFWIHPTVKGEGKRPYEAATLKMRLLDTRQFDSGVTLLRYQPIPAGDGR